MPTARVLCIAPNWLGDCVLARPAVALLGAGGCVVEILVRAPLGRAFGGLPGVACVHATPGGRPARFRAALRLRDRRYDAALVLPPSFSAAVAARLTGARLRAGWATEHRSALLTLALVPPGRDTHLARQYVELVSHLLGALGAPPPGDREAGWVPPMPLLEALPEEIEAATRVLERAGAGPRPALVVAPGARYGPAKRYPPESFAAAASAIAGPRRMPVVLVGEAEDAASTRAVALLLPEAIDLAGRTSLAELVGLLATSGGVIANDSGTMHLAAALGRPVVGVFGSSSARWTRPLGPRAVAVEHSVPCAPCFAPVCRTDFGCMLSLAPERLVEAWPEGGTGTPSDSKAATRGSKR